MNKPKVTIGIPFYNPGGFFFDSIKCILMQSYIDFELILIDDGSEDNSLSIAKSFTDSRIKIISDGKNLGLPARLNQIVQLAKGEYIARMDADDLVASERIEKQVSFLEKNHSVDLVSTGICSITNDNNVISIRLPKTTLNTTLKLHDAVQGSTEIAHATILARKDWYARNPYDESAFLMEDYQLWIDALIRNDLKVGYIKEPLYFYREESSIKYNKIIRAYKNQKNIIGKKYRTTVPYNIRFVFYLKINIKLIITYFFNHFGLMNKLISIRNRATIQTGEQHNFVQKEIYKIKGFQSQP